MPGKLLKLTRAVVKLREISDDLVYIDSLNFQVFENPKIIRTYYLRMPRVSYIIVVLGIGCD